MTDVVDVVIVGAGSAGGVLADRLTENPNRSVVLLESGPDFGRQSATLPTEIADAHESTGTAYDWGHQGSLDGRTLPLYAGRIVGGSSATNNVMALRGHPGNYDAWDVPGWSFKEVLASFCRSERDLDFPDMDWHGDVGPVPIRRYPVTTPIHEAFLTAARSAGHAEVADHNAPGVVGVGRMPVNEVGRIRQSTALTYLAEAGQRRNLQVRAEATVDQVLLDGSRAAGVQLTNGDRIEAGLVVLAAGAFGSPAILLRSGIGPGADLTELGIPVQHDLPGVGANLHDHPLLRIPFTTADPVDGPPRQVLLTTRSPWADESPDLQIFPSGPAPDGTVTMLLALLQPRSRGTVGLTAAAADAPLVIRPALLEDPVDLARIVYGVEVVREFARTAPLSTRLGHEHQAGGADFAKLSKRRSLHTITRSAPAGWAQCSTLTPLSITPDTSTVWTI
jgi:choline dehydrogenase